METNDVLHRHERKFRRSRMLVKVSLAILLLLILLLQYDHIVNWLKNLG
ncbi:hypothetical protein [Chitinophaga arvensicola]|uniref:Uncharacterized protein n=1 Tax=Chitinophaga arvensicola TaxID=29529 RepID=A0A1I0RI72_9BACT|nr:hypothetical protein [Chitinophaga arvensicola]SEW40593.1 hypothetical protein SAMN04488122_2870 [Chitinophaga arvensicola]